MRTFAQLFAVLALVLVACGKSTSSDSSPPPVAGDCRKMECVVAVSCRKNDCSGEVFWNGCCACPPNTVNGFTCDGGAQ